MSTGTTTNLAVAAPGAAAFNFDCHDFVEALKKTDENELAKSRTSFSSAEEAALIGGTILSLDPLTMMMSSSQQGRINLNSNSLSPKWEPLLNDRITDNSHPTETTIPTTSQGAHHDHRSSSSISLPLFPPSPTRVDSIDTVLSSASSNHDDDSNHLGSFSMSLTMSSYKTGAKIPGTNGSTTVGTTTSAPSSADFVLMEIGSRFNSIQLDAPPDETVNNNEYSSSTTSPRSSPVAAALLDPSLLMTSINGVDIELEQVLKKIEQETPNVKTTKIRPSSDDSATATSSGTITVATNDVSDIKQETKESTKVFQNTKTKSTMSIKKKGSNQTKPQPKRKYERRKPLNVVTKVKKQPSKVYITGDYSDADVLRGRGGKSNHHPGNQFLLSKVKEVQAEYRKSTKQEKTKVAQSVVDYIQESRGGRFLQYEEESSKWFIVPNLVARKKVSQALREENTPESREDRRRRYPKKQDG